MMKLLLNACNAFELYYNRIVMRPPTMAISAIKECQMSTPDSSTRDSHNFSQSMNAQKVISICSRCIIRLANFTMWPRIGDHICADISDINPHSSGEIANKSTVWMTKAIDSTGLIDVYLRCNTTVTIFGWMRAHTRMWPFSFSP